MVNTSWSGDRRAFPSKVRDLIMRRAGHRCQLHGPRCTGRATVADHIIPVAEGGTDDPSNGQAVCTTCHADKTREEQQRGRQRKSRYRPAAQHPGLL